MRGSGALTKEFLKRSPLPLCPVTWALEKKRHMSENDRIRFASGSRGAVTIKRCLPLVRGFP